VRLAQRPSEGIGANEKIARKRYRLCGALCRSHDSDVFPTLSSVNLDDGDTRWGRCFLGEPSFWLQVFILVALIALAWTRGTVVGKKGWLCVFPALALVFDIVPLLSMIPLIPTVMHLFAIILGVSAERPVPGVAAPHT